MTLEDYLSDSMHSDAASVSSEVEDDSCDSMSETTISSSSWGSVLACALRRAARQGRLTCGVAAAARTLERGTNSVRLCVLAPPSTGGLLHLHSVLLEAYCYENGIPTVKVDSVEKLEAIVGPSAECVLIHSVRQKGGYSSNSINSSKNAFLKSEAHHIKTQDGLLSESGLLSAAREGTHPSILVLPVSPPP